ncbi:glycosyltransferase family 1 protein, partial [Klebsiella pneumoniae]|nr:glycosyltransferase family 1 protein [Klebsiella pneumoniae]
EKTGVLCEPKNEDSFLSSIYGLLNNEEMRKQMSLDAHSYANTQSWDEIFNNLFMHYNDVIQSRNAEMLA